FPRRIANLFLWLEKRLVRKVDRIINVCEPQKEYFECITDKPISIIMNCKPLQGLEYQPPGNKAGFTVLYIGIVHQGRALYMLVDAVGELPDVRCVIGGIGIPESIRALEEKCEPVPNVDFIGRVPFDEVIPMTMKADVIFFMVNPQDPNNSIALANKQFEAMVCGRPIICTAGTYSGEITEQERVGLSVEYDKEALKQALVRLRDNPELREELGRNALRAAVREYNWQRQEEKLLELYESIKPSAS
ncbi:MAG: glycosyltransferase, partial [Dehalococcoidia bacterium]